MEVMQRAVVKMRTLKPMPGEITDARIRDAALPLKVEAARRAIAACVDLPELLKLKDQAEGLAAAVRIMKTVGPEMIRNANCLLADAWRKGGELLSQYSNMPVKGHVVKQPGVRKDGFHTKKHYAGAAPSPRTKIVGELGIEPGQAVRMVRLASAPEVLALKAVEKGRNLQRAAQLVPPPGATKRFRGGQIQRTWAGHSDTLRPILNFLVRTNSAAKQAVECDFSKLTPDERKVVKAKITDIMELLDEMDRRLKL